MKDRSDRTMSERSTSELRPAPLFHHSHRVGDQVLKYNVCTVTLGLGRGNWFSFVQPPLVQALRTRGRFIYFAPTPHRVLCWAIICGRMHCDCSMHPMENCMVVVPIDVWVVPIALSPILVCQRPGPPTQIALT